MEAITLDELGQIFDTDKASDRHNYLRTYDRLLRHLRDEDITFLEVGWWKGASMRMWAEYLSKATIAGVDIEPKEPIDGVNFHQGDQTDGAFLDELSRAYGGWDVIVDDASHLSPHTGITLQLLWPHLKPGGIYIVEDLHVSYHPNWGGSAPGADPHTTMEILKRVADDAMIGHGETDIRVNHAPLLGDVDSVHFFRGTAAIYKRL